MIENFSIGILSWKSRQTLENTLESYEKNGLLTLTNDITIIFQEVNKNSLPNNNKEGFSKSCFTLTKKPTDSLPSIIR